MGNIYKNNVAICIFISLILLGGCFEKQKNIGIPDIVKDSWNNVQNTINSTFSNLKFEIDIMPVINSMENTINNLSLEKISITLPSINLIQEIAGLKTIGYENIIAYEKYVTFATEINTLIKLLNNEGEFNIELLKKTTDEHDEILKYLQKYSPLVDNYNSVVTSAKNYDENNEESVKNFYISVGVFGFELVLIFGNVWYKTTYNIVGTFYRASGLNRLAFKCPTLISVILSESYWTLNNLLINETSNLMRRILSSIPYNVLADLIDNN